MNLKQKMMTDFLANPSNEKYYVIVSNAERDRNAVIPDNPASATVTVAIELPDSFVNEVISFDGYKINIDEFYVRMPFDGVTITNVAMVRTNNITSNEEETAGLMHGSTSEDTTAYKMYSPINDNILMHLNDDVKTINSGDDFRVVGSIR